jgi:hypothetical protein
MEHEPESPFGRDSDLEDSGERELKKFLSKGIYSSVEGPRTSSGGQVGEPRWEAVATNETGRQDEPQIGEDPEADEEEDQIDYSVVVSEPGPAVDAVRALYPAAVVADPPADPLCTRTFPLPVISADGQRRGGTVPRSI